VFSSDVDLNDKALTPMAELIATHGDVSVLIDLVATGSALEVTVDIALHRWVAEVDKCLTQLRAAKRLLAQLDDHTITLLRDAERQWRVLLCPPDDL
jgi:hypothetical protein